MTKYDLEITGQGRNRYDREMMRKLPLSSCISLQKMTLLDPVVCFRWCVYNPHFITIASAFQLCRRIVIKVKYTIRLNNSSINYSNITVGQGQIEICYSSAHIRLRIRREQKRFTLSVTSPFGNKLAVEICMTLTLTFRMGQGQT